VSVCPFGAITLGDNGLPVIDDKRCTGCGKCVKECPKQTLRLLPRNKLVYLACASHDKGRAVKDVCKVGCTACGLCAKVCPVGALKLEANLPVMELAGAVRAGSSTGASEPGTAASGGTTDSVHPSHGCIDCGICVHKCPTDSFLDRAPGRPKASINPRCNGCAECVKVCPFKAILGEPGQQHRVLSDKCIGCGQCDLVCQPRAIDMIGALGHTGRTA
jgi:ferredoxin